MSDAEKLRQQFAATQIAAGKSGNQRSPKSLDFGGSGGDSGGMDGLVARVERIEARLGGLETRMTGLDDRLRGVEVKLGAIEGTLKTLTDQVVAKIPSPWALCGMMLTTLTGGLALVGGAITLLRYLGSLPS